MDEQGVIRVNRVSINDVSHHMSPAAEAVLRDFEDRRLFEHQLDAAVIWCKARGLVLVTVAEAEALKNSRVPPGASACEANDREISPDVKRL